MFSFDVDYINDDDVMVVAVVIRRMNTSVAYCKI